MLVDSPAPAVVAHGLEGRVAGYGPAGVPVCAGHRLESVPGIVGVHLTPIICLVAVIIVAQCFIFVAAAIEGERLGNIVGP